MLFYKCYCFLFIIRRTLSVYSIVIMSTKKIIIKFLRFFNAHSIVTP